MRSIVRFAGSHCGWLASLALLFCAGCGGEAPRPATLAPPDEWASLPKSPQWLYALGGFNGSRKDECGEAEKWITGESECQASSCEDGRDLAKDWLGRCSKLVPGEVEKVKASLATYEERVSQPDTTCSIDMKQILGGKCGEDKTCEAAAQKWITRCASKQGSPLGVRVLVTFVQRRVRDHDVEMDTHSCGDLRADVAAGMSCTDKFKCEAAVEKINVYRARCQDEGDRPTIALALAEMTILAAAEQKTDPILAVADDETSAEIKPKLPPSVADGSAIVVSVCGARVASAEAYAAARKECDAGGTITFARSFKIPGGFEVREGKVLVAELPTFIARYPSLVMPGEREAYDRERAADFDAKLSEAVKLALDPKTAGEAGRALMALLRVRGREIYRSETMRASISAKDAAFVAALKEIGKVKGAAKGAKAELASIARRGLKHAFSDMDDDRTVRFGAVSWAAIFDTSALLPQSHAAYLTAMKPLLKKTEKEKVSEDVDADEARAFGALADDCQTGTVSAKSAEKELLECAFGQRTCDAAKVESLQKAVDVGRVKSETSFVAASIFEMTAAGKAAEFYRKVMTTAQCEAPAF